MKYKFLGLVLVLAVATIVIGAGKPGVINGSMSIPPQSQDENQRSMADWDYWTNVDISDSTGNLVVATVWGTTARLKGFYNNAATTATVNYTTVSSAGVTRTLYIKIAALSPSGKLPVVASVIKVGTSDSLSFCFQTQ
jgi:hypothetical protein